MSESKPAARPTSSIHFMKGSSCGQQKSRAYARNGRLTSDRNAAAPARNRANAHFRSERGTSCDRTEPSGTECSSKRLSWVCRKSSCSAGLKSGCSSRDCGCVSGGEFGDRGSSSKSEFPGNSVGRIGPVARMSSCRILCASASRLRRGPFSRAISSARAFAISSRPHAVGISRRTRSTMDSRRRTAFRFSPNEDVSSSVRDGRTSRARRRALTRSMSGRRFMRPPGSAG